MKTIMMKEHSIFSVKAIEQIGSIVVSSSEISFAAPECADKGGSREKAQK